MMNKLGMRPPRRHAILAGTAETGGGTLLALGALTPVAATMLTSTMTTAIRKVHGPKGPWVTGGGWEYNAVLIAAVTALAEHGPAPRRSTRAAFPRLHGLGWALASLIAGIAGLLHRSLPAAQRAARARRPVRAPARSRRWRNADVEWCAWWC